MQALYTDEHNYKADAVSKAEPKLSLEMRDAFLILLISCRAVVGLVGRRRVLHRRRHSTWQSNPDERLNVGCRCVDY